MKLCARAGKLGKENKEGTEVKLSDELSTWKFCSLKITAELEIGNRAVEEKSKAFTDEKELLASRCVVVKKWIDP